MEQRRTLIAALFFLSTTSLNAQMRTLPVEKVEAVPITTFSEETSAWPNQVYDSELLQTGHLSLFESLNRIPGVETRGSLSKGSPAVTIRGSTKANRTLLLYDGIPLNLPDGIGGQEYLIPRETLGSVHILKGPASAYYGASAMGGAVNFAPEFYSRSRIRVGGGSFGQKNLFGAASLLRDERNQLVLTGFSESIDGNYPYFSPTSGANGTRNRNDTHTERATASGNHNISGYKVGYRIVQAQETGSTPGSITSPDPIFSRRRGYIYGLNLRKDFDARWSTKIYGSQVSSNRNSLTESTQTTYESTATQSMAGFSTMYAQPEEFQIQLLGDFKQNALNIKSTQNLDKKESEFEPGAILQFPFSEDMIMQLAARHLTNYNVTTKAVGVIRTNENKKFWVSYAEGFRPPSLSDKHEVLGTFRGNPDLKPEISTQIEIGASQAGKRDSSFFQRISYEVAMFSTNYEDMITTTPDFTTLKNNTFANLFGGELSAEYPLALWNFGLGYEYLDASSNSQPLAYSTEQKVLTSVAHYFGPLVLEARNSFWFRYHRTASANDKTNFNTVDFVVRTMGLSDWVFSAGVYNAFDEPIEYLNGYPEPRKRVLGSLEWIF